MDERDLRALQGELSAGSFSAKELALLEIGERLTLHPHDSAAVVSAAVDAGWSPQEVADAIFVISLFNMMTRIADAFALPPDDSHRYRPGEALPMLRCGP